MFYLGLKTMVIMLYKLWLSWNIPIMVRLAIMSLIFLVFQAGLELLKNSNSLLMKLIGLELRWLLI